MNAFGVRKELDTLGREINVENDFESSVFIGQYLKLVEICDPYGYIPLQSVSHCHNTHTILEGLLNTFREVPKTEEETSVGRTLCAIQALQIVSDRLLSFFSFLGVCVSSSTMKKSEVSQ